MAADRSTKAQVQAYRFGVAALKALGLGARIVPAPPELVSLLPLGPTLDPGPARSLFAEQAGLGAG